MNKMALSVGPEFVEQAIEAFEEFAIQVVGSKSEKSACKAPHLLLLRS